MPNYQALPALSAGGAWPLSQNAPQSRLYPDPLPRQKTHFDISSGRAAYAASDGVRSPIAEVIGDLFGCLRTKVIGCNCATGDVAH